MVVVQLVLMGLPRPTFGSASTKLLADARDLS